MEIIEYFIFFFTFIILKRYIINYNKRTRIQDKIIVYFKTFVALHILC